MFFIFLPGKIIKAIPQQINSVMALIKAAIQNMERQGIYQCLHAPN
jgi:hypothetical protein